MTAPTINLDQLEATALAAGIDDDGQFNASNWYVERDIDNVLDVNTTADALHIIAASPAVVLELVHRLRAAEAALNGEDQHEHSFLIDMKSQTMTCAREGCGKVQKFVVRSLPVEVPHAHS